MKTSIIILTHNKLEFTKLCIESIRRYTEPDQYELIVVDNNSTDETVEYLKQQEDIIAIFNKENVGFPAGCNQGIEISTGDNILLLNNDTIVTSNWLDNMIACLYSREDIGAVGPVTNSCSNNQAIPVKYNSKKEMQLFAELFNKSNSDLWEERLKLIGYCMLIKRSVVEKIGYLDTIFSRGNYEDDDYSIRIIEAGYRLFLCKDTFIHHYGSVSFKEVPKEYTELMAKNRRLFMEKWGFDIAKSSIYHQEFAKMLEVADHENKNILEIDCECGATLLDIRNQLKSNRLYGLESNPYCANIAKKLLFADVKVGSVEQKDIDYPKRFFDYILLSDSFAKCFEPILALARLKEYLSEEGKIVASFTNHNHFEIMKKILNGRARRQDLLTFSIDEIQTMFFAAGFKTVEITGLPLMAKTEYDKDFVQILKHVSGNNKDDIYQYYKLLVLAS
ncbi:hypothetical protein SD70_12145 [Gordoniibacillus kamchatkensis]|uniref:Glycosyltransferase 2-like domain-containing protein n=1 Tax=Gordoniibacillus kamchatkensis TaxID=1590651 RepID=A0ABR5AIL6_9BACL|nr:glycosyltransferase family 2 protein [Paenibacillus sp. VKM B-2647]KIL40658.1 hypothetical protein SD70_12145 [Paenibacillus sp. VKM B-2647]